MAKKEINSEEIQILPLSEIKLYEDAPFKVRFDENMAELVESIKENGVLVPAIARPHPEGGVELLSGQRRLKACELAEIKEIPVIVKDLDDDAAIILLVDSNLHREDILPSEKAFAYQMKLEALKRQGKRTDLTSRQIGEKLSVDTVSENSADSSRSIHRYIRLTINELPEEEKEVIRMSYLEGLPYTAIAQKVDKSVEWVRQLKRKGLRKLRHPRISRRLLDEDIDRRTSFYNHRGVSVFNTTWTSSTEQTVLQREYFRKRLEERGTVSENKTI